MFPCPITIMGQDDDKDDRGGNKGDSADHRRREEEVRRELFRKTHRDFPQKSGYFLKKYIS